MYRQRQSQSVLNLSTSLFAQLILYNKQHDNLTKNDHFQTLIATAHKRGNSPACVVIDRWYSKLKNKERMAILKMISERKITVKEADTLLQMLKENLNGHGHINSNTETGEDMQLMY